MSNGATSRAAKVLLPVARRLGLTEAVRVLIKPLPHSWNARLGVIRMKLRARSGEVGGLQPMVPEAALKRTYSDALRLLAHRRGREAIGDYLEFGVYVGTSLACMHDALVEQGLDDVRLFGFDSFEGLPQDAATDDTQTWQAGQFNSPLEATVANLSAKGVDSSRVRLVDGWYDETLAPESAATYDIGKAGVIMIDCDLYSSASAALRFCAPLIRDDAVILFDDWWPGTLGSRNAGEKRAFEEFLAANADLTATELTSYAPESSKVFLVSKTDAKHG